MKILFKNPSILVALLLVLPSIYASNASAQSSMSPTVSAAANQTLPPDVELSELLVNYSASKGWKLSKIYLWIGKSFAHMPKDNDGPDVENFPYIQDTIPDPYNYTESIPLSDLGFDFSQCQETPTLIPENGDFYTETYFVTTQIDTEYESPMINDENGGTYAEMVGNYFSIILKCYSDF